MDTTKTNASKQAANPQERVLMVRDGLYVRGWSPAHQQAICTTDRAKARTWPSSCHAITWGIKQPGWCNAGGSGTHQVQRVTP